MTAAYAISLTSIPPRLSGIEPVLQSLLSQRPAPVAIYLCLPNSWSRFPNLNPGFSLPPGVQVLTRKTDFGPATKALVAAQHLSGRGTRLIYCDDDWIYPPGWAAALLACGTPEEAVAASGFDVTRLKRVPHQPSRTGYADIAQGFGGVSIDPAWLAHPDAIPPVEARTADDVWLSGVLAQGGIPIRTCSAARPGLKPAFEDSHGLQDATLEGLSRHQANLSAAEAVTKRFGLWPAVTSDG